MKQLLAQDICRCMGYGCKESSECLRYTDRPEGRYSFSNFVSEADKGVCAYKITLKELK